METGNKPVMVYEMFVADCVISLSAHACNITEDGDIYDTDDFLPGKRRTRRFGFLLKKPDEMIRWLENTNSEPLPTLTYGDWLIIIRDEEAWATRCTKDKPGMPDCITTFTTYKHYTTSDVEW
jgi:hypothetical protein